MECKVYKAEYADENFEIIYACSDDDAYDDAIKFEAEHGILFELFEIDDNYDCIRCIY